MVDYHQRRFESASHRFISRSPRRLEAVRRRCLCCGAYLAYDNRGQLCAPCQSRPFDYNPRHDKHLDERLLTELQLAGARGVDLCRRLGTDDRQAVQEGIVRLRRAGHMIEGMRPSGYRLAVIADEQGVEPD